MRKKYETPKRDQVVKTRLTSEEKTAFEEKCKTLGVNQSEYLRQMIRSGKVKAKIIVSAASENSLEEVGKMTGQMRKIGGNLNQIAYRLNSGHPADETLRAEVRTSLAELSEARFEFEKKVGELYGNYQAHQF